MNMNKLLRTALLFSITMFVLCGLIYPLAVTGISQVLFPSQANGSLVYVDGQAVGSKIVGQQFEQAGFMKSRPSAVNYNVYTQEQKDSGEYTGVASGSNNYAPSNPKLLERVQNDLQKFLAEHPQVKISEIPAELLTASGSGLDPHISPQSAAIQIPALERSTGLSAGELSGIIQANTQGRFLGVFGEPTVNVLGVNIDIAKALKNTNK